MKTRVDFVTNSSSSSFVLSFEDTEDISKFVNKCLDTGNKDLIPIVIRAGGSNFSKDYIQERILEMCSRDIKEDIYEKLHTGYKELPIQRKLEVQRVLEFNPKFRAMLLDELRINQSGYGQMIEKVDDNDMSIYTTVYDTDNGEIECKIRQGLLKKEFSDWLIIQEDVG